MSTVIDLVFFGGFLAVLGWAFRPERGPDDPLERQRWLESRKRSDKL